MRSSIAAVLLLAACGHVETPATAPPPPACLGEPEIEQVVSRDGMFPTVPPVKNADPGLRVARSLEVPTRVEADGTPGGYQPVPLQVGCHMILGVYLRGSAGTTLTGVDVGTPVGQGTSVAPGTELVLFETDVPPQHEWMPENGRYKVLLTRTLP